MQSQKQSASFFVDGYEVSATFADTGDSTTILHAKQILLSTFIASTSPTSIQGILAISPEQRDNNSGGNPHVP